MTVPLILKGEVKLVPIDSIQPHSENPHQGDIGAIMQSVIANSFYGKVLCQKRPSGEKPIIVVGEHRWRAAKEAGLTEIPIELVEIDDARARRIMLCDNKTAALANDDEELLAELLRDIASEPDGLAGTGYDGDSLDALLNANAESHMPEEKSEVEGRGMVTCPACGHEFAPKL